MKNNSVKNLIIVVITFLVLIALLVGGIVFFFSNYSEEVKDAGNNITNSLENKTQDKKDSSGIGEFFSGLFGDDEDDFSEGNIFIDNIEEGDSFDKGDTLKLTLKAKDIFEDGNTQIFIGIYSKKDKKYVFDKTIENVSGEISEDINVETGNFTSGEYYIDAIINDTDKKDYDLVENGCVYTTTINIK